MPVKKIRGVDIVYEVLDGGGPWIAITPGGRRGRDAVVPLAGLIAEAGYRVLLHDRRNCGASGIGFPGDNESQEQAEDLAVLLRELGTGPAYVAGSSAGSRMSLLIAHLHPEAVKGVVLWRVTGGAHAARQLAFNYYEQYLDAVAKGGIEAVMRTEHFAAMIAANPVNGETLRQMGTEGFTDAMKRWLGGFRAGCDFPVAGLSPENMRKLTMPALIIPGNDLVHLPSAGQAAHRLMPNSVYQEVVSQPVDVDADTEGWERVTGTLAARFINFLRAQEKRS